MPGSVQCKNTGLHRLIIVTLGPAQYGLNTSYEFARRKWLSDVIVRTTLEPCDLVEFIVARGQHDDREVTVLRIALQHSGEFETAHVG